MREFAELHGVDNFKAGDGIGHQLMVENGYAWPETVSVASDSHSNMYSALGAIVGATLLSIGCWNTDMTH